MNMSNEDAEKQDYNDDINENSNNEINEPEPSESISPAINEEAPDSEGKEQDQDKNSQSDILESVRDNTTACRKQSSGGGQQPLGNEFQRSRPSVGQYSLRGPKSLQNQRITEVDTMDSKPLISRRTGKELQHKFNQTSLIWEKKPLAEILHSSARATQGESDATAAEEDGSSARYVDNEKPSFHEYFKDMAEETIHGQLITGRKSVHETLLETITESDHSIPTPAEDASCEGGQHLGVQLLGGDSVESIEHQAPEGQVPSEWQKRKEAKLDPAWINQKTGKEVRSSYNQTSLIWEKKPLAHVLEKEAPNPDENLQAEIQALFQNWPSNWPLYYEY